MTAYSPLGTPDSKDMMKREETPSLTEEETVVEVAKAHDAHPVQARTGLGLRSHPRRGTVVVSQLDVATLILRMPCFVHCLMPPRATSHSVGLLGAVAGPHPLGDAARHQRDSKGHVREPSEGASMIGSL